MISSSEAHNNHEILSRVSNQFQHSHWGAVRIEGVIIGKLWGGNDAAIGKGCERNSHFTTCIVERVIGGNSPITFGSIGDLHEKASRVIRIPPIRRIWRCNDFCGVYSESGEGGGTIEY
jgi:hypothetical protein